MGSSPGWSERHTQLWFDFLTEKGVKGVSKDTWSMVRFVYVLSWPYLLRWLSSQFRDFVRSINADFSNYDDDGERQLESF